MTKHLAGVHLKVTLKVAVAMARSWGMLPLIAILMSAVIDVPIVHAGDPPMSNMEMSGGNTQDPEMRDMMAAPLPFGIMIGRAVANENPHPSRSERVV